MYAHHLVVRYYVQPLSLFCWFRGIFLLLMPIPTPLSYSEFWHHSQILLSFCQNFIQLYIHFPLSPSTEVTKHLSCFITSISLLQSRIYFYAIFHEEKHKDGKNEDEGKGRYLAMLKAIPVDRLQCRPESRREKQKEAVLDGLKCGQKEQENREWNIFFLSFFLAFFWFSFVIFNFLIPF